MHRRGFVTGSAAGLFAGRALAGPAAGGAAASGGAGSPLKARAAAKGLVFGSMVTSEAVGNPAYLDAILRDCAMVTPGLEAKWWMTEPREGHFDFAPLDALGAGVRKYGLQWRLHNLVWSEWNPPWLAGALADGRGEAVLRRHITTVAGRYAGQTAAWDVLNEPADPRWPSGPEGLIRTPWYKALGPSYVDIAFAAAHEADQSAKLFVNDDGFESARAGDKRSTYLRLLESWLKRGVPVHGVGLEAHLRPDLPFDAKAYRAFLAEIAAMGLIIHVTELDVVDRDLPADIAARDRAVADAAERMLDVALDETAVKAVVVWGLADPYSDLDANAEARRPDSLPCRGAPLDHQLRPKPFWEAIGRALDHAPNRTA